MANKPLIYFLCTGNSCRSQMAEGWEKHLGKDKIEVYSGGIETHGLNPRAVATMQEVGVDNYVLTLCRDANDRCPITPPHVNRLHWGFEDPAKATGTEEEVQAKFREVRDSIGDKLKR